MVRIKKKDALRLNKYVYTLFEQAVRSQAKGATECEIADFIEDKLRSDVKKRINAILALGAEVGLVSVKKEGRFVVKKGMSELDRILDAIA